MKLLKFILYLVLALCALILSMGLFGKKEYHIERSVTIKAPQSLIKDKISHWKHFAEWSPWQALDPQVKSNIQGEDGTVGSQYSWNGNKAIGSGSIVYTLIEDNKVGLDITMHEPMKNKIPAFFTLQKEAEGIKTTWGVDMRVPFPWNAFAMLTDMDKAIGADYAKGLDNLKTLCEKEALAAPVGSLSAPRTEDIPAQLYACLRKEMPQADMMTYFGTSTAALMAGLPKDQILGGPVGLYWVWDEVNKRTDMAVGVPVKSKIAKLSSGQTIEMVSLGGNAAVIDYTGPYEGTGSAHMALDQYLAEKKTKPTEPVLETYLNSPATEPDPNKLKTRVIYFYPKG